jgi:hypothetical protein
MPPMRIGKSESWLRGVVGENPTSRSPAELEEEMAVGDFTKQEADIVYKCIEEMFDAIPKSKQMDYIGHFNEALVFVTKAKRNAPDETKED